MINLTWYILDEIGNFEDETQLKLMIGSSRLLTRAVLFFSPAAVACQKVPFGAKTVTPSNDKNHHLVKKFVYVCTPHSH